MIYPDELSQPGAWFSLTVFLACISCVIVTPRIPLLPHKRHIQKLISAICQKPNSKQPDIELVSLNNKDDPLLPSPVISEPHFQWITLDMATAPIIALVLLFITTCLQWDTFVSGIVGDDKIRPYGVIILFMSLSYVCVSLDVTGLFEYIANLIIRKSAGDGHTLFKFFALFASILTLITSNDIVILTLTPICCYLSKNAENLDLIPFVVSQFFLANVWSVAFQIGNPTNMIVAEAYKMNFLSYLMVMGLPALTAGMISYAMLYYGIFFHHIPKKIISREMREELAPKLTKYLEVTIKSIGLILVLVLLTVTSIIPFSNGATIPSYLICLTFALLFLIYDIINDGLPKMKKFWELSWNTFYQDNQTILIILRMPWKIIPFVFGMFVMVELLNSYGFVTLIASFLTDIISSVSSTTSSNSFVSILTSCYVISVLSTLACNVLNNQPMTILFTKILLSSAFVQDATLQKASSLSLIVGSNLGANVTLIGALAGIMWIQILQNNGISQEDMNYWRFLKYGLWVTPLALAGATFVIAIEMLIARPNENQNPS